MRESSPALASRLQDHRKEGCKGLSHAASFPHCPTGGSASFSPPWKVFWVKTTSTGVLLVPQHQKQTGLNPYILFPEAGLSLELRC